MTNQDAKDVATAAKAAAIQGKQAAAAAAEEEEEEDAAAAFRDRVSRLTSKLSVTGTPLRVLPIRFLLFFIYFYFIFGFLGKGMGLYASFI